MISAKYNEIYSMDARRYVEICDGTCTLEQLLQMEGAVLSTLGF